MQCWLFALIALLVGWAQAPERPLRGVTDPGVVTTRQTITPAGVQSVFDGRIYGVTFGTSPDELWILTSGLEVQSLPWFLWSLPSSGQGPSEERDWSRDVCRLVGLDWRRNEIIQLVPFEGDPGLQGIEYDSVGRQVLASVAVAGEDGPPLVRLVSARGGVATTLVGQLGQHLSGSLAVAPEENQSGKRLALLPLVHDNQVAVIDLNEGRLLRKLPTGIAPFAVVVDKRGTAAYLSNWAGRIPGENETTLTAGTRPEADRVVVDDRGIASTGTVERLDLESGETTHRIDVGRHPTALAWDDTRDRLYVANGNDDSISVIDTSENVLLQTLALQPFRARVTGIAPTALAVSDDGSVLYAACGGINAIAVIGTGDGRIQGLIPTAWYPNDLAISPGGEYLAVSSLLGAGSGSLEKPGQRYVHSYRGSISVIPIPDSPQLAGYTTAVAENNHMELGRPEKAEAPSTEVAPLAVPQRAGDPSLIDHVVYIIKENRTYDQLFGDLARGNGDPSLVLFGRDVTPNQHRLAEEFVLLDNFYATGGNSADGHQWLTQANETDYCLWPGYQGRSYPFDGSDPIAYSSGGFIWDSVHRKGRTVRVYGEFAGRMPEPPEQRQVLLERWKQGEDFTREWEIEAPLQPLNRFLARNFPSYTNSIPDVIRAAIFIEDVKRWEREGNMPNLVLMLLPCDHTFGMMPGVSTPRAMVADNDLALGQVVEALTRTQFWKRMAIFVVEDDAQNGVDHVDGHRTVALVVSPYVRRGWVDSTFYSQPSILKTIELMLGLPALSLFDLIAAEMRASFVNTPDLSTYTATTPEQSLFELNPSLENLPEPARQAAVDSMNMRFDVPDAAPTERLNRILWHQIKGWDVPYPEVMQAVFAPLSLDVDDEDRDASVR